MRREFRGVERRSDGVQRGCRREQHGGGGRAGCVHVDTSNRHGVADVLEVGRWVELRRWISAGDCHGARQGKLLRWRRVGRCGARVVVVVKSKQIFTLTSVKRREFIHTIILRTKVEEWD